MADRLSRRTFLRVAAAIGTVTSLLGFRKDADAVEASQPNAPTAEGSKATPTQWVTQPPDTSLQTVYDTIESDVFSWALDCLRLHKHFSKNQIPNITGPKPVALG